MLLDYTQRHETSRNRPATGTATPTGHPVAQGGHHSVGDRPGRGCLREFSIPVGRGLPKAGAPWIAATTDPRSSPQSLRGAEEAAGGAAPEGTPGQGLSHRFMDLETGGAADPPAVRGALSSLSCLETPDPVGMELSEARTPSPATGRCGERPVEARALAAYKKTPRDVGPTSSFLMNRAFCSSPTWPAPGRRKAARRSCAICTNRIGSPRSVRWPCRPSAGEWGSISGCAAAISRGWMSEPSCATCSGIYGARCPVVGSGNHSSSKSCHTMDHCPSQAPRGRVPGLRPGPQSGGIRLGAGRSGLGQQCSHGLGAAEWNAPIHCAPPSSFATASLVLHLRR